MKVDVAGVLIDNLSLAETIAKIDQMIAAGVPSYVVTPYSELVVFADKNPDYRQVLNSASLSLPDGIGILWAARYLNLHSVNSFHAFWQLIASLVRLLVNPASALAVFKERVVGSHFIWDLAKLASEKKYSLSLAGGSDAVAAQTANELKTRYPNLAVKLALSGLPFDEKLVREIAATRSDILLIAYSPPRQEIWLQENLNKLNVKLALGLGGTFDYIAGKRLPAPHFLHYMGLEWLWRLLTQPWRIKRIWNAVPVFIWTIYKHKISKL
jgi:N-acetylglucosaminyldiphosphoundecaprenol N-acetyl-beta-D-mannosaminyltransferase